MNARADLFGELLPAIYNDDDEARAFAFGLVREWYGTLRYAHSEEAHAEILESLDWPGMRDFVSEAALHLQYNPYFDFDFDSFAAGVRTIARRAKAAGLVVESGKTRKRSRPGDATGDLFGGDGSEVTE